MAEASLTFKVKFTVPINNFPDKHIALMISGNSNDEIEQKAIQVANDLARKNQDIKDPEKPVRFVILDADGNAFVKGVNGVLEFIKDKLEDKNDETGTPTGV